jgi:hypothetical protein
MKIQIIPILLTIFLTACAPVAIAVPSAEAAVTLTPTPILEATATAMARPTATENPLAGAPDETATGKDAKGNWIRPATNPDGTPLLDSKGKQVFETWYTFSSGPSGETLSGWFEDHIRNGDYIPILQAGGSVKEGLPMQFKVKDGINAKYLEHEPLTGAEPGGFMGTVEMLLWNRYNMEQTQKVSLGDFFKTIWPNNFSINLTDAQGKQHTIYGDTLFTVVLVDPSDISEPDWTLPNRSGPATKILSKAIYDNEKNEVTILVANTKPVDQWSDQDFIDSILWPYGYALLLPYQTRETLNTYSPNHVNAGSLANMALKGDPYFVISDSP